MPARSLRAWRGARAEIIRLSAAHSLRGSEWHVASGCPPKACGHDAACACGDHPLIRCPSAARFGMTRGVWMPAKSLRAWRGARAEIIRLSAARFGMTCGVWMPA